MTLNFRVNNFVWHSFIYVSSCLKIGRTRYISLWSLFTCCVLDSTSFCIFLPSFNSDWSYDSWAWSVFRKTHVCQFKLIFKVLDFGIHDEAQAIDVFEITMIDLFQFVMVFLLQCLYLIFVLFMFGVEYIVESLPSLYCIANWFAWHRREIATKRLSHEFYAWVWPPDHRKFHPTHVSYHGILVQFLQVTDFLLKGIDSIFFTKKQMIMILD